MFDLPLALVIALACAMAGYAAYVKLSLLYSWKVTSDIFSYDQMLQETLRGNWGLEYTYGNQFGDHALFLFPLLLPFKILLGRQMIVLLVLMGPVVYGLMGIVTFLAARFTVGAKVALLCTASYFLGVLPLHGLVDGIYGGHIDTFTGFVATAAAAILTWRQAALERGEGNLTRQNFAFWCIWAVFLLSKEEMALLGAFFFFLILLVKRNRFYWICFGVTCAVFVLDMLVIKMSASPWNRTNEALLKMLRQTVNTPGAFREIFFSGPYLVAYVSVCLLTIVFGFAYLATMRRNLFALGLFAMGLAKFGLNFMTSDPTLWSWHGFPAITMMLGATIVQLQYLGRFPKQRWMTYALGGGLLLAQLVLFLVLERTFTTQLTKLTRKPMTPEQIARRQVCLSEIKANIDRNKVVAIPGFSVLDWVDGYRYTFFTKGISGSPKGIADYLVYDRVFIDQDRNIARTYSEYLNGIGKAEFEVVARNEYLTLYRRKAIDWRVKADRDGWIRHFGGDTIGVTMDYPIIPATDSITSGSTGQGTAALDAGRPGPARAGDAAQAGRS